MLTHTETHRQMGFHIWLPGAAVLVLKTPITSVNHYGWLYWSFRPIVHCEVRMIAQPKLKENERELWGLYKSDDLKPHQNWHYFFVSIFMSYIASLYPLMVLPIDLLYKSTWNNHIQLKTLDFYVNLYGVFHHLIREYCWQTAIFAIFSFFVLFSRLLSNLSQKGHPKSWHVGNNMLIIFRRPKNLTQSCCVFSPWLLNKATISPDSSKVWTTVAGTNLNTSAHYEITIFIKFYFHWVNDDCKTHPVAWHGRWFCLLFGSLTFLSSKAKTARAATRECIVPAFNLILFCHESCLIDSPTCCLLCLQSVILCMQRVRHRRRLRVELEWSSAPFTPLKYSSQYDTLCFLPFLTLRSVLCFSCPSHFSSLCDMWSFHFIPVWLSRALKYWSCLTITSCSIAGSLCSSFPFP